MHYEINVSLNGRHFFATHERSIKDTSKLKKVLLDFIDKFPRSDGYEISVSEIKTVGYSVEIESIEHIEALY